MTRKVFWPTILSIILAASFVALAQEAAPSTHLKVGDAAPDFTLQDHNGKQVKLSDFRGKKNVVLAFYIKASTGG
jgi:cytochrome oxidase Cu insertion factor (SCO1/SenC/PrrC family)